jgi:hypothetical protein
MTNRELIERIKLGRATDGQRKEYARRKRRLVDAPACVHGHFECALVENGPCIDETLAACADGGHDD